MAGSVQTLAVPTRRRSPLGRLSRRLDYLSDHTFAALMFIPAGLLVVVVALPPIAAVFGMSFWRIELLRDGPSHFVGLTNFQRIGSDTNFIDSIPRTVLFALGSTVITIPMALGTAM